LLDVNDIISFFFLVEISQHLIKENKNEIEFFCLFVNWCVMGSFSVTWTILEIDWILSMFIEKCSKILSYGYQLQLIRVNCEIKYFLCQMNSISDDDDMRHFRKIV